MDFQRIWEQIVLSMGNKLPSLLTALAILVAGFIVAFIISKIVKSIFGRLKLNQRLRAYLPGTDVEGAIGSVAFYIMMAFVMVAVFQTLQLDQLNTPLNELLKAIFAFLPKLIGAAILAFVAWCVAKIASTVVKKALEAAKVDAWLNSKSGTADSSAAKINLSATIAKSIFGIVILMFLPSILEALGMSTALVPFNNLIGQFIGFLPNFLSAVVVLLVGNFVAQLVRQIATNLLAAAGVDKLADRVGAGAALGSGKLSGLLGSIAYLFLLLPFVVASLDALKMEAVSKPASMMLGKILNTMPNLFGAMLVLGISYVVGKLVSGLIVNVLQGMGFDGILTHLGLQKPGEPESKKLSSIAGGLLLAAIMMYAFVEAANLLGFSTISVQIGALIVYCGKILMALVVVGVGLFLGNFTADLIRGSESAGADQIATGVRIAVIVLFAGMALNQTGIGDSIVNIGYASILGGVGLALALAVGLSFGLGARDTAGAIAKQWHACATKPDDAK